MPEPRGRQGTVRGLKGDRVQDLLSGAVAWLIDREAEELSKNPLSDEAGTFTRAELKAHFATQDVTEAQAEALVHAFWRAIPPLPSAYGRFWLPEHAEEMAAHRNWRMTSGRLQLADILALRELFEQAAKEGRELTPGLLELKRRYSTALKGLKLKPKLKRKRP